MQDTRADPPRRGLRGYLDRLRRTRTGRIGVKVVVTTLGVVVVAAGIVMIPFPGPGWAVVIAGLAILALEYAWAHHLMTFTKKQVTSWLRWVGRQHLLVRMLIGLAGFVFVSALVWFSLKSTFGFDYVQWGLHMAGLS